MARPALDISEMTTDERLELIAELWDSIEDESSDLSSEQRAELQRRMADVDAQAPAGISWSDVKSKLLERVR